MKKSIIIILAYIFFNIFPVELSANIIKFRINIDDFQRCCGMDLDGDLLIDIYDINGEKIGSAKVKKDGSEGYDIEFNTESNASGFYFLTITDSKTGLSTTKKFVF